MSPEILFRRRAELNAGRYRARQKQKNLFPEDDTFDTDAPQRGAWSAVHRPTDRPRLTNSRGAAVHARGLKKLMPTRESMLR